MSLRNIYRGVNKVVEGAIAAPPPHFGRIEGAGQRWCAALLLAPPQTGGPSFRQLLTPLI